MPKVEIRRSPDSAFLMTVEQYQAAAETLRAQGNEYLAQQYDNLIKMRTKPKSTDE
jgi:hypothetical protein